MHNIPQVERIAAVLRETGLSEPAVEKLAASLVEPEPGTVTPQEVASADASVLILLAAIIALTRIREDRDAPSHLLQFLGPRESELDAFSRGRYWHLRGYVAWRLDGSIYRAYTALNRSIRLLEGVDDHGYLARVWDTYGQLLHYQGLFSTARLDYGHALELRRRDADEPGAALTLGNLARVSMELGDFVSAAGYLLQDLEIVERLSPSLTGLRTQLHSHLGICLLENGDPEAALAQFQECLRLVGDDLRTPAAAFAQIGLARVALARGKGGFLEAEQSLVQARACDTGDELFLGIRDELKANIAYVSGDIHWARDDTSAAGDDYRIALAHFDESLTSSPVEHAQLLHKLARVELRERRRLEGAQLLREALKHLDATAMDQLRNDVEKELKEASREIWLLHCAGRFLGQGQLDLLLEQAGQRG
ncbi:MAG: tetratricopeptide repeat protein, partial [Gammaproteobacteria bacterium]|nr:tetratricopeptide repeat protein [Gammaproteobacteria bacterium]